ncbi:MAG TPA: aspartate aminotransferase family protein, partial [Bacteroidota bacterium]
MLFEKQTLPILDEALKKLEEGFSSLPGLSEHIDAGKIRSVLCDVAERLQDNYPYFHPMYAGQMLKPPHPVARLAYMLALWINPNNHALDGGKA